MLSAAAIAADLDALAEAWAWTPEDVLVHGLPLFHVHGLVLGVLGALRVGSRLIHTGRPTPAAYAAAAAEGRQPVSSACRRSGPGWPPTPEAGAACGPPGCWCRAAPACRSRLRAAGRAQRSGTGRALRDDRDPDHA